MLIDLVPVTALQPIPVAVPSKMWICGRSLVGIVGSNPAGGIYVCVLCVLCVFGYRSLRRADHSSGGVLLTVVFQCNLETSTTRKHRSPRAVEP